MPWIVVFADFKNVATPIALTAFFAAIAQGVRWLIDRGNERRKNKFEANKDRREGSAEERAEESQDVETLRNIANDALAREKFAYEQLRTTETRVETLVKMLEDERTLRRNAEDRTRILDSTVLEQGARIAYIDEDNQRMRRHIAILENRGGMAGSGLED